MTTPLESARAKLRWARHHLNSFGAELAKWRAERHFVSVVLKPKPQAGEHSWVGEVTSVPPVPDEFSLIIGDVIHNLRSALDHITWVLADWNRPNRGEDPITQFPILTDPNYWQNNRVKRWVQHLSTADVDTLEKLQPYHTANPAKDHPLAWLEDLSNRDKHRRINAVAAAPEFLMFRFTPIRDCEIRNEAQISGPLKVGTEAVWLDIVPTGPEPEMKVDSVFSPTVGIAEEGHSGLTDFVLPNLYNAVVGPVRIFERILRRRP